MSFNVSSKIKLNLGKLNKLSTAAQVTLEQTTDALLTEIKNTQVMPFDVGTLQNDDTFADFTNSANGITKIVSNTPYARRLYFHPEYNFDREENTAAGGKWLRYWLAGGTYENFCTETFAKLYRRNAGL